MLLRNICMLLLYGLWSYMQVVGLIFGIGAWMVLFKPLLQWLSDAIDWWFVPKQPDGPTVETQLNRAKAVMARVDNLVAQSALWLLEDKHIEIKFLRDIAYPDYRDLMRQKHSKIYRQGVVVPMNDHHCLALEKSQEGLFFAPNRIYVSSRLDLKAFTKTLVHELCHYHRYQSKKVGPYEGFNDELRARLTEDALSGHKMTRTRVLHYYHEIKKHYPGLPAPDKPSLPDDMYLPKLK